MFVYREANLKQKKNSMKGWLLFFDIYEFLSYQCIPPLFSVNFARFDYRTGSHDMMPKPSNFCMIHWIFCFIFTKFSKYFLVQPIWISNKHMIIPPLNHHMLINWNWNYNLTSFYHPLIKVTLKVIYFCAFFIFFRERERDHKIEFKLNFSTEHVQTLPELYK